jgi:methylenetetrahydrofolate reductase (NADPH)
MPALALTRFAESVGETAQRIATFMRGRSIEVPRLEAADLHALKGALPAGTQVFLTAVAGRPASDRIEAAARLRALGFEPVPHIAVRDAASRQALGDLLARLAAEARVRKLLIVGGDQAHRKGPFGSAIELIESGLLQRHGIAEIAIAGYPEGHPRLPREQLERALIAKLEAADQTGLPATIVTQFGFEPAAVLAWLRRLRALGIEHPVRIGMAGPTDLSTLLRYARRCGVGASASGLARGAGLVKHLLGASAPDRIIRALAEARAEGQLGRIAAHLFSFGGAGATARWATAVAAGRLLLDRAGGFGVEPP